MLGGDDPAHFFDHLVEPLHLGGVPETLGEHQVEISLQRVPEHGGTLIPIPLKHLLQIGGHTGEVLDGADHVLQ